MNITRHTGINRHGKHERPVTIIDDDGRIFDTVLYFDTAPSIPNIEAAAIEYVNRVKRSEAEMPEEEMVAVREIEAVLKMKGITDKWKDWKTKPTGSVIEPKKEE